MFARADVRQRGLLNSLLPESRQPLLVTIMNLAEERLSPFSCSLPNFLPLEVVMNCPDILISRHRLPGHWTRFERPIILWRGPGDKSWHLDYLSVSHEGGRVASRSGGITPPCWKGQPGPGVVATTASN